MGVQTLFGAWDYVVLAIVLIISSAIGVYYRFTGGKQKTTQEYLLADRNMAITPVAISLMASFMSAITLLGVSSENYTYGIQFMVINFSYGIFTPVAAYLYLPIFFRLQATSAYEYLERRFGKVARLAASLSYSLQMTLYMGIVLYAPALALEALTGISQLFAILSIGLVCTFYSAMGGMKAVLMTDVFQSFLMFAAVFSIIICALIDKGSFYEIWRIAEEGQRTNILNFDPNPTVRHSWFSVIIGGGITFLSLYGVNQTQVQRYLTLKDLKSAQKALWLNWPILTALSLSTSFSGLAIYSRYFKCDPYDAGYINSLDQLMPYYVVDTMSHIPGLSGLFVAGIFSASLSTISASVNSLVAVTIEDYYKPIHLLIFKKPLAEKIAGVQTKFMSVIFGLICIAVAFLAQFLGNILQAALTMFGVVGGPLLGLFSLGMFTTVANQKGSVTGMICGIGFALWMAFGKKPPIETLPRTTEGCENGTISILSKATAPSDESVYLWIHRVSYFYNGFFGLLITMVLGYGLSLAIRMFGGKKVEDENYDPRLFIPCIARKLEKKLNGALDLTNSSASEGDLQTGTKSDRKY